ncbi:hypothetical protein [Lactobacillus delbrueckii]|uniref:hypothetical protein n=1 Tax=Lactobacillus delbrueckii TaxID=1584 RepID=UPI0025AFE257|nr:hypothetical protein [Lactobacillus delbrueckii]
MKMEKQRRNSKPVLLYNMRTEETRFFPSMKLAAKSIGVPLSWIYRQVQCHTATLYGGWTVIDLDE